VIHRDLAAAATALAQIAQGADARTLAGLVPLFAKGVELARRDMLLYLLDTEPEWPWNQPDGEPVSCQ